MLATLLVAILLLAVVGAFAARIGLREGRLEAADERQELDHPLLRDALGLPELRRVPKGWKWNPALIRDLERDVFGDTAGFWFHPLPGEQVYAEALTLNPHWPADKVDYAYGPVTRMLHDYYDYDALDDVQREAVRREVVGFVGQGLISHTEAVKAFGLPGSITGGLDGSTPHCRSCGVEMLMHVGYCDQCVRAV